MQALLPHGTLQGLPTQVTAGQPGTKPAITQQSLSVSMTGTTHEGMALTATQVPLCTETSSIPGESFRFLHVSNQIGLQKSGCLVYRVMFRAPDLPPTTQKCTCL